MTPLNVDDLLFEERVLHVPTLDELIEGRRNEWIWLNVAGTSNFLSSSHEGPQN